MEKLDGKLWDEARNKIDAVKGELAKIVVGQEEIVREMLVALLSDGHCLVVGVPGLAKTLLVETLGKILGLSFRRIQFTPDMMPSDILGCEILQDQGEGKRKFEFAKGPIFANMILADEINRTPPKTQSALLEAMQERQVTTAGRTLPLPKPFLVFATQNPIEHEGTYPLPEAQLDRFFFNLRIDYPELDDEREIVIRTTTGELPEPKKILNPEKILLLQKLATEIPVPEHVMDYILKLPRASRPETDDAPEHVKDYVAWGAGPRASQNLARAAKSLALLEGNPAVSQEDVKRVAMPVLRHRIIPNYNATGENVTVEEIISKLIDNLE